MFYYIENYVVKGRQERASKKIKKIKKEKLFQEERGSQLLQCYLEGP
jgi:hypothetical protein